MVGWVGTLGETKAPSDEPTIHFLVASDELQKRRKDSSVGWTDGPLEGTVGLSDDQVQTRQRRAKIHVVAPDEPAGLQRCIRRLRGSYQRGFGREVFSTGWCDGASEQLCQRSCAVEATASSTGWTDARKNIASDHLTVLLSSAFSQQLVWCLGLFIPPPLAHLRLQDCVEV
jgi:hypothetical protein